MSLMNVCIRIYARAVMLNTMVSSDNEHVQ